MATPEEMATARLARKAQEEVLFRNIGERMAHIASLACEAGIRAGGPLMEAVEYGYTARFLSDWEAQQHRCTAMCLCVSIVERMANIRVYGGMASRFHFHTECDIADLDRWIFLILHPEAK